MTFCNRWCIILLMKMSMNILIIILIILVIAVMIYLTYALGGFNWISARFMLDNTSDIAYNACNLKKLWRSFFFWKGDNQNMAKKSKGTRIGFSVICTECKRANYTTEKNKKNDPERLELEKYCPFCKKHTKHKETK